MNHHWATNRSIKVTAILARLVLIASLWQAPVPWLHCHDADPIDSIATLRPEQLARHLTLFHGDWPPDSDHDFGWHCHWIMPFWSPGAIDPQSGKPSSALPLIVDSLAPLLQPTHSICGVSALGHFYADTLRVCSTNHRRGCAPDGILSPARNSEFSAVLRC